MGILSAGQANVVAQVGRMEVSKVVDPEVAGKAVDFEGRLQ